MFSFRARLVAMGCAMVAAATLPIRAADGQGPVLPTPDRLKLKVSETSETHETRGRRYTNDYSPGESYETGFDSVVTGRDNALTYFPEDQYPRGPWRVIRDASGLSRLVNPGQPLPPPDYSSNEVRRSALSLPRHARGSADEALISARRLLEHATMFEDAPAAGTTRSTDVRERWHSFDLRLEFTGSRSSTRIRDSVSSDGGRFAIVRDRATYVIVSVSSERRFTSEIGVLSYCDTIRATSTGTRVVSLATGRSVVMWDTVSSTGRHVRRDIDGLDLPFRTEVRQTRRLRWQTDAEELAEVRALVLGVTRPPANSIQTLSLLQRARNRDPQLRDSLIRSLGTPLSFSQRSQAGGLLAYMRDSLLTRRWRDSLALVAGDTAWIINGFASSYMDTSTFKRITAQLWHLVTPYLRDRRWAWDRGIDTWAVASNLIDVLHRGVPAFTNDREAWACDSVTCESIAREYQSTRKTVLQPASQVGLAMRALLRPAPWADSLLAHDADYPLLRQLRAEILGKRFTPTESLAPDLDAPWRDWMYWKYGIRSDGADDPIRNAWGFRLRLFDGDFTGRNAALYLRWRDARAGSASGPVLRARYAAAVNDSERVVFATMLSELDLLRDSVMQVAQLLSSDNAASRLIGRMQLERLRKSAIAPDSISAAEVRAIVINNLTSSRAPDERDFVRFLELASATPADSIRLAQMGVTLVSQSWRPPEDRSTVRTKVSMQQLGPLIWVEYDKVFRTVNPSGTRYDERSGQLVVRHRTLDGWRVVSERSLRN